MGGVCFLVAVNRAAMSMDEQVERESPFDISFSVVRWILDLFSAFWGTSTLDRVGDGEARDWLESSLIRVLPWQVFLPA